MSIWSLPANFFVVGQLLKKIEHIYILFEYGSLHRAASVWHQIYGYVSFNQWSVHSIQTRTLSEIEFEIESLQVPNKKNILF